MQYLLSVIDDRAGYAPQEDDIAARRTAGDERP